LVLVVWVCKICGEAYISDGKPSRCPFCGAYDKYLVESTKYDENGAWDVELNEIDLENVKRALQVEISNALFYKCSAKKVKELDGQKLFKILAKVESEHASVWKKILKLDKINWEPPEDCSESYTDDLNESHEREGRAIKFYAKATQEAENDRVREIFKAFIEVETDHLKLSEIHLQNNKN